MEIKELYGSLRKRLGKSEVRQLRSSGYVPGVLYGKWSRSENINCEVALKELNSKVDFPVRKNQLYRLCLKDETKKEEQFLVFLKDWQMNPLKNKCWEHLDFFVVDEKQKVRVSVPVAVVGKSKGVIKGGVVQIVCREVEVEGLPADIPETIPVSVEDLDMGQSIHINDISPAQRTSFHAPSNFVVVTIAAPEKEPEVAAAKPVEEAAEAVAEGAGAAPAAEKSGEAAPDKSSS